jgi:hypothetical protein
MKTAGSILLAIGILGTLNGANGILFIAGGLWLLWKGGAFDQMLNEAPASPDGSPAHTSPVIPGADRPAQAGK